MKKIFLILLIAFVNASIALGDDLDFLRRFIPDGVTLGMKYEVFVQQRPNAISLVPFTKTKPEQRKTLFGEKISIDACPHAVIYNFVSDELVAVSISSDTINFELHRNYINQAKKQHAEKKEVQFKLKGKQMRGESISWKTNDFDIILVYSLQISEIDRFKIVCFDKSKIKEEQVLPELYMSE